MRHTILAVLVFGMFSFSSLAADDLKLTVWSDGVFDYIEQEYGRQASKRMRRLHDLVHQNQGLPTLEKLKLVNNELNKLPWIADKEKYHVTEYWATPLETVATFGGDCEDIAISKFLMLRLMGIPKENLFLGVVKIRKSGQGHLVTVWLSDDRQTAYVLDNFSKQIRKASKRSDLEGIALISPDGTHIMLDDDGRQTSIRKELDGRRMAKLDTVIQRMKQNQEQLKQYNNGQPVILGF